MGNEHSGVDIVNVVRPRNKNGNLTLGVFLDFHLTVPKKVALDGFVYNVSAYKRPPPKMFQVPTIRSWYTNMYSPSFQVQKML